MRAVVYHGPGRKAWEEVPIPVVVDDTDAIVRVDAVTICGTDLHILKGDVPAVTDGRILGHEAVGTVESVGTGVKNVRVGDRVLVSCITACGACRYCREGRYGQCLGGGGWILGHLIDGTQAEYVRVPFADTSTYRAPAGVSDEQLLMLADILPTGYEVGVLNGHVQPGDVVAVVGAGPIGLAAIMGARLYSPSHIVAIDLADSRLEAAKQFGADVVVNNGREDALEAVRGLTDGLGADVAIEAVGTPATFELTAALARPGGHIAEHRRPRRAFDAAPRGSVDPRRDDHDGPGRHVLDPDPAAPRAAGPGGSRALRHAPLHPRPVRRGLRRVRERRRHRRAEGRAHPGLTPARPEVRDLRPWPLRSASARLAGMTEPFSPDELASTPTIEVTVFRHGEVVHRELCETEAEAAAVADRWGEMDGVECQVDDLSVHHRATDVLEPTEAELSDDDRHVGDDESP